MSDMSTDNRGNIHAPVGTSSGGQFQPKANSEAGSDISLTPEHPQALMDVGITREDMDHLVQDALGTALWVSSEVEFREQGLVYNDETGDYDEVEPQEFGPEDFSDDSRAYLREEITEFIEAYPDLVKEALDRYPYASSDGGNPIGQFAHDFVLTQSGSGTGFWDRKDLEQGGLGDRLTEAVNKRSGAEVEIGDDGCVHFFAAQYIRDEKKRLAKEKTLADFELRQLSYIEQRKREAQ